MKKLAEFTYNEYRELKSTGMFWEFYPEATGNYNFDKKISAKGGFKIENT